MLSWERRTQLAETALQRSEAGRTRLRTALAEQRAQSEERGVELERQLLAAQRQLREIEAGGGTAMTDGQLEALRGHIEHLVEDNVKAAADKELQAQSTLLASAHTFHVQQQRFHDRLQAELAKLHDKERLQEENARQLQSRLQALSAQLTDAHATPDARRGAAGAPGAGAG